jgi:hypothetical protein
MTTLELNVAAKKYHKADPVAAYGFTDASGKLNTFATLEEATAAYQIYTAQSNKKYWQAVYHSSSTVWNTIND